MSTLDAAPSSRLTGNRCRCGGCGEFFNSESVFTRHRAGPFEPPGRRRCLTATEMSAKGWRCNGAGFWIRAARAPGETRRGRCHPARQIRDRATAVAAVALPLEAAL